MSPQTPSVSKALRRPRSGQLLQDRLGYFWVMSPAGVPAWSDPARGEARESERRAGARQASARGTPRRRRQPPAPSIAIPSAPC